MARKEGKRNQKSFIFNWMSHQLLVSASFCVLCFFAMLFAAPIFLLTLCQSGFPLLVKQANRRTRKPTARCTKRCVFAHKSQRQALWSSISSKATLPEAQIARLDERIPAFGNLRRKRCVCSKSERAAHEMRIPNCSVLRRGKTRWC